MIILFVRHADAINDKLTKIGQMQCELLSQEPEQIKFSKIYSSPLERCVKTAEVFAKKFNLKIQIENNLREREQLDGKLPKNKKEQIWYDNYLNLNYSSKVPEGCKEYLKRTKLALKKIVDNHFDKNENVILVAHSVTSYALAALIYGYEKDKDIKWLRVGNCSKIYFEIKDKV